MGESIIRLLHLWVLVEASKTAAYSAFDRMRSAFVSEAGDCKRCILYLLGSVRCPPTEIIGDLAWLAADAVLNSPHNEREVDVYHPEMDGPDADSAASTAQVLSLVPR